MSLYGNGRRLSDYLRDMRRGSEWFRGHVARPHSKRDLGIFAMLGPGQRTGDLPEGTNPYRGDAFRDRFRKLPWDAPSNMVLVHLSRDGLMHGRPDGR